MNGETRTTHDTNTRQPRLAKHFSPLAAGLILLVLLLAGCDQGGTVTPVPASPTVASPPTSTSAPLPSATSVPASTSTSLPLLSPTVEGDAVAPWSALVIPDTQHPGKWTVPQYVQNNMIEDLKKDWAFIIERQDDYLKNGATKPLGTDEINHYASGPFLEATISNTLIDAKNNLVTFATYNARDYTFADCETKEGISCTILLIVTAQQMHTIDLNSGIPYKIKDIDNSFTGEYVITMKYSISEKWWKIDHFVIFSAK